jgi:hypothetical protein
MLLVDYRFAVQKSIILMTITKFYTEKEIAKRFGITIQSLCKLRKNNEIDFIKVGASVRYPEHVYNGVMLNPNFNIKINVDSSKNLSS